MAVQTISAHQPGSSAETHRKWVRAWLIFVAILVFAMIVVGGATRLTDSGLSITEWQPILGAIPPLSHADWEEVFAKYRQIPEYHIVNDGMTLEQFQFIFWWEWSHRFLGRFIGVAVALPLVGFWLAGWLRREDKPRLIGLLALGGLQGAIGWYMVKSGLVDRVDVSQYRLALHLSTAFLIFAALVWLIAELRPNRDTRPAAASDRDWRLSLVLAVAVFVQVVLGAFVAGTKSGLVYNTWPLMDGEVVPTGIGMMSPWWMNIFENHATIQFNHRMVAYLVAALALWQVVRIVRQRREGQVRRSAIALGHAVLAQIALGIWTLLEGVPIALGLVHQAGAAVVFACAIWHLHETTLGRRVAASR
jgi:cytochrome c oxidase assembly protein subunit 15